MDLVESVSEIKADMNIRKQDLKYNTWGSFILYCPTRNNGITRQGTRELNDKK